MLAAVSCAANQARASTLVVNVSGAERFERDAGLLHPAAKLTLPLTAGVACFRQSVERLVTLGADGRIEKAGLGVTGVADTPFAATDAEAILVGKAPSDDLYRQAGAAAGAQSSPGGDVRGPVDYQRAMVAELTLRALRPAVDRANAYA